MKKTLFLLSVLIVGIFSCSSDNSENTDDDQTPSNNIIGTWQVTEILAEHPSLGAQNATDIEGTITFRENGSGKEDYTFMAVGMSFSETESFNWVSTNSNIITDPGTDAELIWTRLTNTPDTQKARYTDENDITFTLTLEK